MAGASADKDANSSAARSGSLGANSDSVLEGSRLEGAVKFEWFGDLTSWKVTKVLEDRGLGELHVLFYGSHTCIFLDIGPKLIICIIFTFMLIAEGSGRNRDSKVFGTTSQEAFLNSTGKDLRQHCNIIINK